MPKEEKTLDEQVADGQRIEALLRDPATQEGLAELDARYWKEAKAGKSDEEIRNAVAKARALDDLNTKFNAIVQNGKVANAQRERTIRR